MPALATLGLLAALLAPPPPAATPLDTEMQALARQVLGEMKSQGSAAIALGEFTGPAEMASTGGPRIVASLRAQLEKLGVSIRDDAPMMLRGEYRPVIDDDSDKAALRISSRLVEPKTGRQLVEFHSRGLFDLAEITAVTGSTVSAPVGEGTRKREEKISEALDEIQPPRVRGTRISASQDGPYGIEILVGPDPGPGRPDLSKYRPRAPAITEKGLAFVKLERDEVYAVKLINDSEHAAAVALTIDGLGMFAFSDRPDYKVVIVPAGKSGIVPGWHRTNEVSDAFQVSEYAKSAAAKALVDSSTIGTIHASFKAAWPEGAPPPADESEPSPPGARSRDADATARGKPIDAKYNEVVRHVGRLREAVAVRYNKAVDPSDLPDSAPKR